MSTPTHLIDAKQEVINAVLYQAYAQEAYGGRLTTDETHTLDYSQDRVEEALEAYVKAATQSAKAQA